MNKRFALTALVFSLVSYWGMAAALAEKPERGEIGTVAPDWKKLKGVDDKDYGLKSFEKSKVIVIVFTCNHCPVAQSYDQRYIDFVKEYEKKSVKFVAISCSDLEDDSFEEMKKHAEARKFNFLYLDDADQSVGYRYGAERTPHCYVLDEKRKIVYSGAFDDDWTSQAIKRNYVTDAVEAALAGEKPAVQKTKASGCPIDYPRRLKRQKSE